MANYNKGKIAIPNVTGDIVITITAVQQAQENSFPSKFYDTDGVTLYDGKGYKSGFRFNSSHNETAASSDDSITGYLDITGHNKVTVSGAVLSATSGGYKYVFYDANHTVINIEAGFGIVPNGVFAKDGTGDFEIPANTKYIRFCVNTSCCTGNPPALTVVLGGGNTMTWEIAVGIFAIVSFATVVIGWSGKISDASDSFVPKEVADETDEAIDSSKEYVKVLDETTLHIDKVIESLLKKTKTEEYNAYYAYCEECKARAKEVKEGSHNG